jgi:hypothetical protein
MVKPLAAVLAGTAFSLVAGSLLIARAPAAGPVQFRGHDIDASFRNGYWVGTADFNKDGRIDVIATSYPQSKEFAWYENPGASDATWQRHVIVTELQSIVNFAMDDLDGDGTPELAIQSGFAMQAGKSSGENWIGRSSGDPRKPWTVQKIDAVPTSHRVVFADLDGDGRKELVNAPLTGLKALGPTFDQDITPIFWYDQQTWTRHVVAEDITGIVHGIRAVNWDNDNRDELLVASFEGVVLYKASGSGMAMKFLKTVINAGHNEDKAPRLGSSDISMGLQDGRRFVASLEPFHGNEVVVYNDSGGKWQRRILFDKISSGHGITTVDLNGDGRADVIANDNGRVTQQRPDATPGVHVFYAPDDPVKGEWTHQRIEDKLAMNACVGADINGDKRMDLVCTGAGATTRWYENLGAGASNK